MDNWNTGAPQQAPVMNVGTVDAGEKVVVTIKAGTGFDAPWVVFHAANNAEAADLLGAAQATGLFALVAEASKSLQGQFNVGQILGGRPVQAPAAAEQGWNAGPPQQAPVQQQQPQAQNGPPPGHNPPSCPHGVKQYITKVGAKGPWHAWGCPAPKNDPSQCGLEFFRP